MVALRFAYVWLFNGKNKQGQLQLFSAMGVQWVIKEAVKRAGIKKYVTSHVLRHTYATYLLENCCDSITINWNSSQRITGRPGRYTPLLPAVLISWAVMWINAIMMLVTIFISITIAVETVIVLSARNTNAKIQWGEEELIKVP